MVYINTAGLSVLVVVLFVICVISYFCAELFAVMFMRANIVGTVIILSLIVWIPASCIVAFIVSTCHKSHLYL